MLSDDHSIGRATSEKDKHLRVPLVEIQAASLGELQLSFGIAAPT